MNKVKIEIIGSFCVELESKECINDLENRARLLIKDIRSGKL